MSDTNPGAYVVTDEDRMQIAEQAYADGAVEKPIPDMSDRELLEELVAGQRLAIAAIEGLSGHPMVAAIMSGQNPMLAAMGINRG